MNKKIFLVGLALLFIASAVVFAYDYCFFANGVTVSIGGVYSVFTHTCHFGSGGTLWTNQINFY
jgi:type 1 fimbria pilin